MSPVIVEPYETSILTFIWGKLNIWNPSPLDSKLTYFPLLKSTVEVAPIPASANWNVSSVNLWI